MTDANTKTYRRVVTATTEGSLLSGILIPAISRMLSFLARKLTASIFKPLLQRLVLLVGEGRVQMFDRDVGRGDQYRLGVRERVEAILSVIVAHPSQPGTAKRHGFDEQVN